MFELACLCNTAHPPHLAPLPFSLQADASEQLGTLLPRERHKQAYSKALVDKFKHMPEIKRITRHRHLPAAIYKVRLQQRDRCTCDRRRAQPAPYLLPVCAHSEASCAGVLMRSGTSNQTNVQYAALPC